MKRIASILTVAAAMFALGWWTRSAQLDNAGRVVETRIDTVYYERPQPIATTCRPVTVNVPRILFAREHEDETAPAVAHSATTDHEEQCANNAHYSGKCSESLDNSGNVSDVPTSLADSVAVVLDIETRTYEDSLYRAQISGPAVAGYRPALDWIEVYGRTNTITRTETKRHRFAVTTGVGAAYTPRGFQPTIGVQVGVVLWSF